MMSNSANSSTTPDSSNSKNSINESKQSVVKKFFKDIQAKQPNSWCGKCSQDVSDIFL
jgi:hypothetical protein